MSHFIKIHWPFWLRLLNWIKYIGQIGHFNQVDWLKKTFFEPLVKMDISISKKWPLVYLNYLKNQKF